MLASLCLGRRGLLLAVVLVIFLAGAVPDEVPEKLPDAAVSPDEVPDRLPDAAAGPHGGLPPLVDVGDDGVAGRVVVAVRSPGRRSAAAQRLLSRKRRYIVFPKGSSIQMVAEFTVGSYVPLTKIFTTGITWGIAWKLPTHSYELYLNKRAAGEDPDRPHRAELLANLAVFLDKFGLQGEHCVRRTLCDLQARRADRGGFMEELLKALFTFPDSPSAANATCEALFPHGVSILDVRPEMTSPK